MPNTPTVPSMPTGSVPISPPNGASTLDIGQTSAEPTAGGTGVDVSPGEVSPSVGPAATEDTSGASTTGDNPVPTPSTSESDSTAPRSDGSDDATSDGENSTEPAGDTSTPVDDSTGDDSSSVAPTVDPNQVEGELASLPCGARYAALGDGGWNFCLRLQDGGGACAAADSASFTRVTFGDGTPVSDVAQVIGAGTGDGIMVATTDGALYAGGSPSNVNSEPLIASGVVNISAGANPRVALIQDGDGFAVMGGWWLTGTD